MPMAKSVAENAMRIPYVEETGNVLAEMTGGMMLGDMVRRRDQNDTRVYVASEDNVLGLLRLLHLLDAIKSPLNISVSSSVISSSFNILTYLHYI